MEDRNKISGNKQIVFYDAPGQTCNRFWAYLDSVAWAILNNKKVVIWHWDQSLRWYDALRNNEYTSFPFYSQKLFSVIGEDRWQRLLKILLQNRFVSFICRTNWAKRNGLSLSWPLRKSYVYFPQMKNQLKFIFRPNEDLCRTVEDTMRVYKSEGYFVIGVHIRRGDYKEWEGGKYYFELSDYAVTMHACTKLFKNEKVAFFISTNERIDVTVFSDFTLCRFNNITAAQDLHTLSLCDRIIGPLSTFSRWASWYGDVPLAFIEKGQTNLKDENFSIIHDFYHFENGNEIVNLSDK